MSRCRQRAPPHGCRPPRPLPTALPADSLVVQEPSALSNKCALSRRDMCFQSFCSAVSHPRQLLPVCLPPLTFRSAVTTPQALLPPRVGAQPPPPSTCGPSHMSPLLFGTVSSPPSPHPDGITLITVQISFIPSSRRPPPHPPDPLMPHLPIQNPCPPVILSVGVSANGWFCAVGGKEARLFLPGPQHLHRPGRWQVPNTHSLNRRMNEKVSYNLKKQGVVGKPDTKASNRLEKTRAA